MTVHRLLGAGPAGFRHGERDPLPADVVVVDEASMLDTRLALAVAAAVRPGAQLILVGGTDQLPSVGPGQVLRDLLASGACPRRGSPRSFARRPQPDRGQAHRVRAGQVPELLPAEAPAGRRIASSSPPRPRSRRRGGDAVGRPAAAAAPGRGGARGAGLASLTRVCQTLNAALQATLNPARGQAEGPHGALALRTGDRVIQTRNHYGLGVFNGDTGTVGAMAPDD